jgi:hypothetical protein
MVNNNSGSAILNTGVGLTYDNTATIINDGTTAGTNTSKALFQNIIGDTIKRAGCDLRQLERLQAHRFGWVGNFQQSDRRRPDQRGCDPRPQRGHLRQRRHLTTVNNNGSMGTVAVGGTGT